MTSYCNIYRINVVRDRGDYQNTEYRTNIEPVLCRIQPTRSYNRRRGDDAGQFENMKYIADAKLTVPKDTDIRRGDIIAILDNTNDEVVENSRYVVTSMDLDDSQWNPCIRANCMIMRD
mgnify:CR=1 FL=1